jgi:hypothetical protein
VVGEDQPACDGELSLFASVRLGSATSELDKRLQRIRARPDVRTTYLNPTSAARAVRIMDLFSANGFDKRRSGEFLMLIE